MRLLLLCAAMLAAGCTDPAKPADPADPADTAAPPAVVGGYSPADAGNADVVAAEKLAVDEIYRREPQRSIVENVTREQQVVAGMNYRFTIKMSGMNSYRVVVFKPLPGQGDMSVTAFEKLSGT
jgi:hypothetical protein